MSLIAIPTGASGAATLMSLVQTEPTGTPVWVPIVIIVILLLLLWWGLTRGNVVETDDAGHDEHGSHDPHAGHAAEVDADHGHADDHAPEPAVEEIAEPEIEAEIETRAPDVEIALEPDDLKKIEGIGPKIAGILNAAGIATFAQLASTDVATLEKIVREDAGIRIAHPETWPEQAQLAADGRFDELEALQDALSGGRRK